MVSPYVFPGIKESELVTKNKKLKRKFIQPKDVLKIVSENFGVTVENVLSRCRKKEVSEARHIYCKIMKAEFNYSLKSIGETIGNRDHTTVIHSIETVNDRCHTEEGYEEQLNSIIDQLYNR